MEKKLAWTTNIRGLKWIIQKVFEILAFIGLLKAKIDLYLRSQKGRVAERLGRGLQNLVRRFESVPDLTKTLTIK